MYTAYLLPMGYIIAFDNPPAKPPAKATLQLEP